RLRYGPVMERESSRVLCLMTQRRRLDEFMVERALEAGATFRDGVGVVVESETQLLVGGEPVEVDALIGADGANGITARSLGLGGAIVNGVALEGNLPYSDLPAGAWRRTFRPETGGARSCWKWRLVPAGTAGSSPRPTT